MKNWLRQLYRLGMRLEAIQAAVGNTLCLGISTDHVLANVLLNIISKASENGINTNSPNIWDTVYLCEVLRNPQTDSLGKGIIIYWPHIKWEDMAVEDDSLADWEDPQ